MKPSDDLRLHRDAICLIGERIGAANTRAFGSILHGQDTALIDLDILVNGISGRSTLLSLARIRAEIQALNGIKDDVVTPLDLRENLRHKVIKEARTV